MASLTPNEDAVAAMLAGVRRELDAAGGRLVASAVLVLALAAIATAELVAGRHLAGLAHILIAAGLAHILIAAGVGLLAAGDAVRPPPADFTGENL